MDVLTSAEWNMCRYIPNRLFCYVNAQNPGAEIPGEGAAALAAASIALRGGSADTCPMPICAVQLQLLSQAMPAWFLLSSPAYKTMLQDVFLCVGVCVCVCVCVPVAGDLLDVLVSEET